MPRLLDVEDLINHEPDWKCVYTYLAEYYKCLRELDLVPKAKNPVEKPS